MLAAGLVEVGHGRITPQVRGMRGARGVIGVRGGRSRGNEREP
mgnify:CR=1 FL=1